MHIRALILALFVASTPASSQPQFGEKPQNVPLQALTAGPGVKQKCPANPEVRMARSAQEAEFSRLGELPPGALSLAVMREVDGCAQPVVVRYGYGGGPSKADEAAPPKSPRPRLHR